MPDQQTLCCDLDDVPATLESHPEFKPPVITVVGDVVRAASHRTWFTEQPLLGARFVITSPLDQGRVLRDLLAEQGAQCELAPAIEIAPPQSWSSLDASIETLADTDWLIFSSVHGAQSFFQRLHQLGHDARKLAHTRVAAVGASTAHAMLRFGIRCDIVPQSGTGADALWTDLQSLVVGKRVSVVRAPEGKRQLLDRLTGVASRVIDCEAYRQQPVSEWSSQSMTFIESSPSPTVVATSTRIATIAAELLSDRATRLRWLSISGSVTATLHALGCTRVTTSPAATFESLVKTAVDVCDGN